MRRIPLLASFAGLAGALLCLGASTGCVILGTPDASALTTVVGPPAGAEFKPVGLYVVHRCGSLDCHGEVGRNMRIYGEFGLRLSDAGDPSGGLTTPEELVADYETIVTLEPEIMSEVVEAGGVQPWPQRLTFIRKPTGLESHKGGQLITSPSDPQYLCLTSWLQSKVDTTACASALETW